MRIILDTNVLLAALPKSSRFRVIISGLATGQIELVISTSILLEYQEIISRKTNTTIANNFLEFLLKLPNVIRIDTPFTWGIIEADPDDNKFIDAGLMAGADYIITYDSHFDIVKSYSFPKIGILTPDEFIPLLEKG